MKASTLTKEVVQVKDFDFKFPDAKEPLLKKMSFSLKEGEFTLIIGPGSCGKSCLCTLLNNVLPHTISSCTRNGEIIVDGKDVCESRLSEISKLVSMVFQNPEDQMCELKVAEEVGFGPSNLLVPREEIIKRVDDALSITGMSKFKDRLVTELSGGEKQRIAIAGALAMDTRILILDNPGSNLDPVGVSSVLGAISTIRKKKGITIAMVAVRELEDVIQEADHIILLNKNGEVAFDGNPHEWIEETGDYCKDELGIWIPQVSEIAIELKKRGAPISKIPLTVDEAFDVMKGKIELHPEIIEDKVKAERNIFSNADPAITVKNVQYTYPTGTQALKGVSAKINRGELVAVVGQNGAGKTTLCSLLTNFRRPTSGDVVVLGRNTKDIDKNTVTPQLGYAFQYPEHQFVKNTVYEDVAYTPTLKKENPELIDKKVTKLLQDVDLMKHKDSIPVSLSMGEKRRLSVIDVLIGEPEIIVLDEPTFGLDYNTAVAVMNHMKRLNKEGRTIICISHDMRIVAGFTPHTIVMRDGEIIFDGNTRDVFANKGVLTEAGLTSPQVFRLAERLNPEARILTSAEFLEAAVWR